jgi:enoyl-CoA hydratase/carnithine racemase
MIVGDFAKFEVRGSIGIITLSDPPANALALPGFIPEPQFEKWASDTRLKGLVITGTGKNFSAGGNLTTIFEHASDLSKLSEIMRAGLHLLDRINALEIPVVAAINRICFGGGLEIALACHIRVASENALFAFPEVNANLLPGMSGTFRLPRQVGTTQSIAMILGGDTLNAQQAKEIGLIDILAPKDQAFDTALSLLSKMTADRPVKVIRSVLRALHNAGTLSTNECMREETRLFCELASDEARRRKNEVR